MTGYSKVLAQQGGSPQQPPQAGGLNFLNHYQQLQFSLPPDQSQVITLPKSDTPVRIDVSTSQITVDCGNNITEVFGPIAFGGVWSIDSTSGKISPLGDNSTGNAFAEVKCVSESEGAVEISLYYQSVFSFFIKL